MIKRPYGRHKRPQNFQLLPETIRRLEEASERRGMSKTVYVELALEAQFKKDRV